MHFWPNKSIDKSSKLWNVNNVLANRPKGIDNATWDSIVKEEKLNKKIILDCVPKASKAVPSKDEKK
jgi:hypothetical protein